MADVLLSSVMGGDSPAEIGSLVTFDAANPAFSIGTRAYLKMGVLDALSNYPNFPVSALGGGKYATMTKGGASSTLGWSGLAFGAGVYVTVADPQLATTSAASSTDGTTWTTRTLPTSANWVSVAYGNGVFVAVSGGNTVSTAAATSPDGITWTARTLPSVQWHSVIYGDKFVAVGGVSSTTAATSTDGITWTARTLPTSANWQDVAWSGSLYVAVAGGNGASTVAASSPDGITWTARTLPTSANWVSVAYGNGVFVAVSGGNTASIAAATSPDGITWTRRELPANVAWTTVRFGDGVFIAGALSSAIANVVEYATSTDGIVWTKRKGAPAITNFAAISGICITTGRAVMVTGRSSYAGTPSSAPSMTSTDTVSRTPTSFLITGATTPPLPLFMRMN